MTKDENLECFSIDLKNIEGTTIEVPVMRDNQRFTNESKEQAANYEWLYHCTTFDALIGIIENREFWLTNLQLVNDDEEAGRIDVPAYENSYYIACFSSDDSVPEVNWDEYGNKTNGVLFSVKRDWFSRNAVFMTKCNQKDNNVFLKIYSSENEASKHKEMEILQNNKCVNPYFIFDFDFYEVKYGEMKKDIQGDAVWFLDGLKLKGRTLTPNIAGIVKSVSGICTRHGKVPYIKDWESENEVRLKAGISQLGSNELKCSYFPKIAVPLTEYAFSKLCIRFSPNFKADKIHSLEKLQKLLPNSEIKTI